DPLVTGVQTCALPISADEARGREARRIDRESRLDGPQRQRAADDHGPQVGRQLFLFHVAVDLVGVQRPGQVAAAVRLSQVAVERSEERRVGKAWRWGW